MTASTMITTSEGSLRSPRILLNGCSPNWISKNYSFGFPTHLGNLPNSTPWVTAADILSIQKVVLRARQVEQ